MGVAAGQLLDDGVVQRPFAGPFIEYGAPLVLELELPGVVDLPGPRAWVHHHRRYKVQSHTRSHPLLMLYLIKI